MRLDATVDQYCGDSRANLKLAALGSQAVIVA